MHGVVLMVLKGRGKLLEGLGQHIRALLVSQVTLVCGGSLLVTTSIYYLNKITALKIYPMALFSMNGYKHYTGM